MSTIRRARVLRLDETFGRGATVLLGALIASGGAGVALRLLAEPGQGRAVDTVFLVLALAAVPFDAALLLVARDVARRKADGVDVEWRSVAHHVAAGTTGVAAIMACSAVASRGARVVAVTTGVTALMIVAAVIAMGAAVVPRAVLVGRARYSSVALAAVVGAATRVLVAVGFATFDRLDVVGVAGAVLLGELVACLILWRHATATGSARGTHVALHLAGRELLRAGAGIGSVWALALVELWVSSAYLPVSARQPYAGVLLAVRAALFVPQAAVMVAVVSLALGGHRGRDALRLALRLTAGAGIGLVAVMVARSPRAASTAVPVDLAFVVGLGACALGLLLVLVSAAVVRGGSGAGAWWAVGAVVLASSLWHGGPAPLAAGFVLVTLAALARLLAGPALVGPASTWPEIERRLAHPLPDGQPEVTVIVPFFNPGAQRLRRHLLELLDTLEREAVAFEVLAVSDGSTDGSDVLAAELATRGVRTVALARNSGKGAALRAGLHSARGRYLGFIDADGDLPADLWHHFLTLMRLYEADMVVGSKHHPLSQLRYPATRRLMSRAYRMLVHALFRVDVTDTQTGIKLFRRDVLADVLPFLVESGFVFDLELLVVARRHGWRRVLEAPVRVEHQFTSTVSIRTAFSMLASTMSLAARVHVLRRYDAPPTEAIGRHALHVEGTPA